MTLKVPAPADLTGSMDFPDSGYRRVLPLVRWLTRRDPERALHAHLWAASQLQRSPAVLRAVERRHRAPTDTRLEQNLLGGLKFDHPVGIAAGFDKNAAVYPAFIAHYRPAFLEVGTVTLHAQLGNPRPRVTRHNPYHLGNRMGFPNVGVRAMAANMRRLGAPTVPLGVNIGKLKDTIPEAAPEEYAALVRELVGLPVSYLTINVSSPNTPGLRSLQQVSSLRPIVAAVCSALLSEGSPAWHSGARWGSEPTRRVLIKVAPDLHPDDLAAVAELVVQGDLGGMVISNTLPYRDFGGMSGPALYPFALDSVRRAATVLPMDRVIVASGGISSVERAYEMLRYADLISLYTPLVLQGPGLLSYLAHGILDLMKSEGITDLADLRAGNRC